MNRENSELKISSDYLQELIDYCGRSLAGKLLKRFEIIEDRNVLKSEAKELIYEQFRQMRDLIVAHAKGLDITEFNFKHREKPSSK